MARHLQTAGYRTGIIGKWHLGGSQPFNPRQRGFGTFFGFLGGGHWYWQTDAGKAGTERSAPLIDDVTSHHLDGAYLTSALSDRAVEFVQASPQPSLLPLPAIQRPSWPVAGAGFASREIRPCGERSSPDVPGDGGCPGHRRGAIARKSLGTRRPARQHSDLLPVGPWGSLEARGRQRRVQRRQVKASPRAACASRSSHPGLRDGRKRRRSIRSSLHSISPPRLWRWHRPLLATPHPSTAPTSIPSFAVREPTFPMRRFSGASPIPGATRLGRAT